MKKSKDKQAEEKHLDSELLFFYICVAIFTLILYLVRHPIISIFHDKRINSNVLSSAYSLDLIIFLAALIPYLMIIFALIIYKIITRIKINDNIIVVLFFPLLSFFTKGMSLLNVYIYYDFSEIIKDNFAFFSFLLLGPFIVCIHFFIIWFNKKRKNTVN